MNCKPIPGTRPSNGNVPHVPVEITLFPCAGCGQFVQRNNDQQANIFCEPCSIAQGGPRRYFGNLFRSSQQPAQAYLQQQQIPLPSSGNVVQAAMGQAAIHGFAYSPNNQGSWPRSCRNNCGRAANPALQPNGVPYSTCCQGCGRNPGQHDIHCCQNANIPGQWPPQQGQAPAVRMCIKGCGRAANPALQPNGAPYSTCCRSCSVSCGTHDATCAGGASSVQTAVLCSNHCGRPANTGKLRPNGKPYTTCCQACGLNPGQHDASCGNATNDIDSNKVCMLYHGTKPGNFDSIFRTGLRPSNYGRLGKGVYLAVDPNTAEIVGRGRQMQTGDGGEMVIFCEVDLGKLKKYPSSCKDSPPKDWADQGYDSACVLHPPWNLGNGQSTGEFLEICVKDPNRVKVKRVLAGKP